MEKMEDNMNDDSIKKICQCTKKKRDCRGDEGALVDATIGDPRSTRKRSYSKDNGDDARRFKLNPDVEEFTPRRKSEDSDDDE